jgi:hypothetical protein
MLGLSGHASLHQGARDAQQCRGYAGCNPISLGPITTTTGAVILANVFADGVKDWKIIADNLSKTGWTWGCTKSPEIVLAKIFSLRYIALKLLIRHVRIRVALTS